MRTSNPALNDKVFQPDYSGAATMTLNGAVMKTGILLAVAVVTASISWIEYANDGPNARLYFLGGAIGGMICALITCFKPTASPITAPLYAACEGLFLGAISSMYETQYDGIVFQAALCTFGTLGALLMAYTSRLIKATENFKLGVVAATGAIALVYLASFVLRLFGVQMPFIHDTGVIGIGISAVIIIVAALNLVLDFDFIENGASRGAPKYMEWYAAFGLMVTLVWLYVEFLRLLAKLNSRD